MFLVSGKCPDCTLARWPSCWLDQLLASHLSLAPCQIAHWTLGIFTTCPARTVLPLINYVRGSYPTEARPWCHRWDREPVVGRQEAHGWLVSGGKSRGIVRVVLRAGPLCDKRLTLNFHTPLVQAVAKMADANKSCSPVAEAYCVWTENGINMVDMVFRSIFAVKEPLGTLLPHMKLVIDGLSTRIQNADPEALVSPLADRPVRPKGSGLYSNHTDCCSTA